MDKLNLNLYVEQVNHNSDGTVPVSWEGNEELALSEVVDPNTEFKPKNEENNFSVSPVESYNLTILPQNAGSDEVAENSQQIIDQNSIVLQIEEAVSGGLEPGIKIVPNDSAVIPLVHSHIPRVIKAPLPDTMELKGNPENGCYAHEEFQNKLLKYPPDRITVVSEKKSYLRTKRISHPADISQNTEKDRGQPTSHQDSSLTASNESVATLADDCTSQLRRNSMFSSSSVNNLNSFSSGHDPSTTVTNGTTTDQLLWAFRLARDKLDTASNISECSSHFELDSNCSERFETISSISDVSGYEEEMYRIRRLLLSESPTSSVDLKCPVKFPEHNIKQSRKSVSLVGALNSFSEVENNYPHEHMDLTRAQNLNVQLQNAIAEKEKYRIQLAEIESKLSLEWQDKYYDILRQKAHTEGRLEIVQAELESVSSEHQRVLDHIKALENEFQAKGAINGRAFLDEMEKLTLERNNFQQLSRELEQQNQEKSFQLELKDSEINRCKEEIQELESSNEKLRNERQELKIKLQVEDRANQGLQQKVTDQHDEFQMLHQAKLKAESNFASCKNEMESIRNSGNWYRDQLHICQAEKLKVQQELMASQATIVSHIHLVEKLKSEKAYLSQLTKDVQQRAVKEKEQLMRKLESIQADIMEREAAILSQVQHNVSSEALTSITTKLQEIEENKDRCICGNRVSVMELEEQREILTSELKTKDASIKNLETENSNLLVRLTMLQKTLTEKELLLQSFENRQKQLEMTYYQANETLKQKEHAILEMKNETIANKVALKAAEKEKEEIDLAINKIRNDFDRFSKGYHSMKIQIENQSKCMENMEKELRQQSQEKEVLLTEISELKNENENAKTWQLKIANVEKMEEEIQCLTKKNAELVSKLSGLKEALSHHQNVTSKLEKELAVREQQLLNLNKNFEVFSEEQDAKDNKVMSENKNLKELNDNLKEKLAAAEENNTSLLKQLEDYKTQIFRADEVISQFNDLCRGSELEKHHLDKQLRKTLKELKDSQIKSETENNPILEVIASTDKEVQVQSDADGLVIICNLVESNLKKTAFLLSNFKTASQNVDSEKPEICGSAFPEIATICGKLRDLQSNLDKAIEERKMNLEELEKSHSSKEKLEFRVVRMREETDRLDERSSQKSLMKPLTKELNDTDPEGSSPLRDDEKAVTYLKEVEKFKSLLRMTEIEHKEKHRRYETNVRTLLKKVKEHMRGRKVAEQMLQSLQSKIEPENVSSSEDLQLEVQKLQRELETRKRQYEDQKRIAEQSQSMLLELEKERGKLAQSHDVLKEQRAAAANERETSLADQLDCQNQELEIQKLQRRVAELEEETESQNKMLRDFKKKVFMEKCENSQLKKHLSSVHTALDAANEMLDNKNIEFGRNATWCELLSRKHSDVQKMLEQEQLAHEECREELMKVKAEMEETRAKDPILASQIKTLSYHLHQKSQEASGLKESFLLAEDRWLTVQRGLEKNVSDLEEEIVTLRSEFDSLSRNKLLFQTQAAELRSALQSSLERNQILQQKLEACTNDNSNEKLPDLTSSLPLPPTKYDEKQIAELLHQSAVLPDNKPLSNLQSCLDSLKQEMATLQMQLTANTLSPDKIGNHKFGNYSVQDV